MGKEQPAWERSVRKPEERLLRGPRCRWEGNVRMRRRGIRWGSIYWICQAKERVQQLALVNVKMSVQVP